MIHMDVERAGMHSLFQDLGRTGYQKVGVSVNGPMDEWSHRLANALVGNSEDCAVLECTLSGPRVHFSDDVIIAFCGADMEVTVRGRRLPSGAAVYLRRGEVLDVGERQAGARAYIAVRGGFATPAVLGSRSTSLRGGFGGIDGRPLRKGDRIPVFPTRADAGRPRIETYGVQSGLAFVAAAGVAKVAPADENDIVRFIPGPHWNAFTPAAHAAFTSAPYILTPQSDRMGMRLEGPVLQLNAPLELVSEATVFGTVQVPPDGQPIVLMADRESAGGYPKIGYVASADLPKLAQRVPGDPVRFLPVPQADAEALWREFNRLLNQACAEAAAALKGCKAHASRPPTRPAFRERGNAPC